MRLSGWQRLWVVLVVIYSGIAAFLAITNFPIASRVRHTHSIYRHMDSSNVEKIVQNSEDKSGVTEEKMPNGHVLTFREGTSNEEIKKVARDYYAATEKIAQDQQPKFIMNAFLLWIIPSILLYILGWSIGWIYQGFK